VARQLDGEGKTVKLQVTALVFWLSAAVHLHAHIGSPNVFFEGRAGPYPVRLVIRPPGVIPGQAEISVRAQGGGIQRVSVLPIKWNAGRQGAPPPDEAKLVSGETNLYSAELWFMEGGAQSVEVSIAGAAGQGKVIVPMNAIATRVLPMPGMLERIFILLGVVLVTLLLSIVGAAVRESVLSPGDWPTNKRRWGARGAIALAAVIVVGLLWFGKRWWDGEAADYRNNRLYQPRQTEARVRAENGLRILRLEMSDGKFLGAAPLVPDHGKLMHLFLVREPRLDAFAHLHPVKRGRTTFDTALPDLPAGSYRVYADITYETGFSDTLTTLVEIPEQQAIGSADETWTASDADDSWRVAAPLNGFATAGAGQQQSQLSEACTMVWSAPDRLVENRETQLRFTVRDSVGRPVSLEPYMGMRGHLALRRDDGAVFNHLHPGGSISMAALQLSVLRTEGKLPMKAAFGAEEPICKLPGVEESQSTWMEMNASADGHSVSFPYEFPKPGRYRLWVQVKINGRILTGVFDAEVVPARGS
jgi:hypothetical protein